MAKPDRTHTAAPRKRKATITADAVRDAFKSAAPRLNPPCAEICTAIAYLLNFVRETEDGWRASPSPIAKDYAAVRDAIRKISQSLPKIIEAYERETGPNMRPAAALRALMAAAARVAENWPSLDGRSRRPDHRAKIANIAEQLWILAAQDWQRANPGVRVGNPSTGEGRAVAAIAGLLALADLTTSADALAKAFTRKIKRKAGR